MTWDLQEWEEAHAWRLSKDPSDCSGSWSYLITWLTCCPFTHESFLLTKKSEIWFFRTYLFCCFLQRQRGRKSVIATFNSSASRTPVIDRIASVKSKTWFLTFKYRLENKNFSGKNWFDQLDLQSLPSNANVSADCVHEGVCKCECAVCVCGCACMFVCNIHLAFINWTNKRRDCEEQSVSLLSVAKGGGYLISYQFKKVNIANASVFPDSIYLYLQRISPYLSLIYNRMLVKLILAHEIFLWIML